jgi:hypothetical protein
MPQDLLRRFRHPKDQQDCSGLTCHDRYSEHMSPGGNHNDQYKLLWIDCYEREKQPGVVQTFTELIVGLDELWRHFLRESVEPDGSCTPWEFQLTRTGQPSIVIPRQDSAPIAYLHSMQQCADFYTIVSGAHLQMIDNFDFEPLLNLLFVPLRVRDAAHAVRKLAGVAPEFVRVDTGWVAHNASSVAVHVDRGTLYRGGGYDSDITTYVVSVSGLRRGQRAVQFSLHIDDVSLAGWYVRVECDDPETGAAYHRLAERPSVDAVR